MMLCRQTGLTGYLRMCINAGNRVFVMNDSLEINDATLATSYSCLFQSTMKISKVNVYFRLAAMIGVAGL